MKSTLYQVPHRRLNPLNGEWLLLSPQRTSRPWNGADEKGDSKTGIAYDANCYLCPGNKRANGIFNKKYSGTYVFENDYPALKPNKSALKETGERLFQAEAVNGTSKVICFSDRHDLTLAEMEVKEIYQVVDLWATQSKELAKTYQWAQIFENKGSVMGCSNPHPHGQIWASSFIPELPLKEEKQQQNYLQKNKSILLMDYQKQELIKKERIVYENETWVCLVPFWAIWPFEVMILPKAHTLRLEDLSIAQKEGLADLLKTTLVKYDNIFKTSFPYSMGWHGAPNNNKPNEHWQLHAHYFPPLLRSATIKKFMVGYEMLGNAQRDITPESAAEIIQKQSTIHYHLESD